ncbi:MAG TPA: tetratricopeptide repeat protein [Acidobacteriota bacterium]|jgi:tetratricopeptide (TPR) repeat protein
MQFWHWAKNFHLEYRKTIRGFIPSVVVSLLVFQYVCSDASAVTSINQKNIEQELEVCKQLIAKGRPSEAISSLNDLKQRAPRDSRLYFFSGMALAEKKQLDLAAAEFEEAKRLGPNQPEYAVASANVLSLLGRTVEARRTLRLFEQRGFLNRLATDWLWLLCDVYYRLERTSDAAKIVELYAQRKPNDPKIPLRRGQINIVEGNFERAEDNLRKAVAVSPGSAEAYFELGKVLWLRSELASSRENSLAAVRLSPTNPEYLYQLGKVCMALSQSDEAVQYLERAESSGADPAKVFRALGEACEQRGDSVRAKEYFEKYQQIVSRRTQQAAQDQQISNLIEQGQADLEKGRISEARASFQRVLQLAPNTWLAHAYLAESYLSGEPAAPQSAYPHLLKMRELDPDSAEGNTLTALYWYKQQDPNQARVYAEQAKMKRPGHAELRNLLGNIYFALGQPNKALEEYAIAVRLAPERWDFKQNYMSIQRLVRQKSKVQP